MRPQPHNSRGWVEPWLRPGPALPLGVVVFLAGSLLYVWLRVEPLLEYHSYGPYFYRHWVFLETFLGRPGGLACYAGVWLAQFNCLSWLGALVFVVSEGLVWLAAHSGLARVSGRAPGLVALAPPFVLLLLRNRYACPVAAMSAGLLVALAAAAALLRFPWRRPWALSAVGGLASVLIFYVAGLWPALLFATLCGWFLWVQRSNWRAGLGCLVLTLVAPVLAVATGNVGLAGLLNPWGEGVDWFLATALYASVPVAGVVLAVVPAPARAASAPATGPWTLWRGQCGVVVAFVLGWAAVWLTFDRRQKLLAEMDYYANCGQYEAVLRAASGLKVLDHPAKARLLLALYHTGRLAESLFSFHDMVEEAPSEGIGQDYRAQSQPLFELGLVNDAEHAAHEALESEGDRPDLLRLLARINLLKDRPRAAHVFLNVLGLIPFQGQRPDESWPMSGPQMPAPDLALLNEVRPRMLTNDVLHDGLPVARLLDVLLASHPTNQMAFEYLMAYHLLDLELKEVAAHLPLLNNFNYPRIPRPYEEALLLFQQLGGERIELRGRAILPETTERYRRFREAIRQFKGSPEDQAALAANFGDTYWYYYYAARGRQLAAEGRGSGP